MVLDNLAVTLSPDDQRYLNRFELLRERLAARDIDVSGGILCDKDEAVRRDQAASAAAQAQKEQTDELLRAEIRKLLAEGVKNLTQADKNSAAADAATAKTEIEIMNASLGALERGVTNGAESGNDQAGNAAGATGSGSAGAAQQPQRGNGPSPLQIANNPLGASQG